MCFDDRELREGEHGILFVSECAMPGIGLGSHRCVELSTGYKATSGLLHLPRLGNSALYLPIAGLPLLPRRLFKCHFIREAFYGPPT